MAVDIQTYGGLEIEPAGKGGFGVVGLPFVAIGVVYAAMVVTAGEVAVAYNVFHYGGNADGA